MQMPEHVKKELKELHEAIDLLRERHIRELTPIYERIAFINNCYPQPILVPTDIANLLTEDNQ